MGISNATNLQETLNLARKSSRTGPQHRQRNHNADKDNANSTHEAIQDPPPAGILVADIVCNVLFLLLLRLEIQRRDPLHVLRRQIGLPRQWKESCHEPTQRKDEAKDEGEQLRIAPVEYPLIILI